VEEIMTDVFELTRGTECEPKPMLTEEEFNGSGCIMPDVFLEYKGVKFGIGMDNKLWIRENDSWRKA
jgi:hypothetical protein